MSQFFQLSILGEAAVVIFDGPKIILDDREPLYDLVENQGIHKIVLDFRAVKMLTSAPIGLLLNMKQRAEARGGKVVLCHLDSDIREILQLTAVEKLFTIFDSEEDAINSFHVA